MVTKTIQTQSRIVEKIVNHYSFQAGDIQALQSQLETQLTVTYRQTIGAQLRLYSCQKTATGPDAISLKWIQDKATKDATSIAATYLRELTNKVNQLRASNPKGNRFYYFKALEEWSAKRDRHKIPSIALNTATAARQYAQTRFVEENNIQGRWVFTGPPPVCKVCLRIKALGAVTWETTKKRPLPAHSNCPHRWAQLIPKKISCDDAWTG